MLVISLGINIDKIETVFYENSYNEIPIMPTKINNPSLIILYTLSIHPLLNYTTFPHLFLLFKIGGVGVYEKSQVTF